MIERIPFSVVVVDRDDRTVTLHGESLRLPLSLGPLALLYEYRHPTFVTDARGERVTRRPIRDTTLAVRAVVTVLSAIALVLLTRRKQ